MKQTVFAFEEFQLDCEGLELSRNGRHVKVERKPLELLILLVRRNGDLVTRAEIAERLWEPSVFVDTEHGINTAVRKIRRALGDNPAQPRFVQTAPGKGYRFIATAVDISPVPEVSPQVSYVAPKAEVDLSQQPVAPATRLVSGQLPPRKIHPWFVFGSIAAALLVALGANAFRLTRPTDLYAVKRLNQITTFPGAALHPSYSPDGGEVTFSWDGEAARSIYVALPFSEQPLRLTHSSFADDFPVWSPDGRYIAFLRLSNPYAGQLMLVSPIGGPERTLHAVDLSFETASASSFLAWTPDSKWVCFTTRSDNSKVAKGSC